MLPSMFRRWFWTTRLEGVVRVIVEMRAIDVPGLARASGEERRQMMARRVDEYAKTRRHRLCLDSLQTLASTRPTTMCP